jgi:hypothetical protein
MALPLSKIPAMRPPPGVRPNFDNPVSRAYQVHVAIGLTAPPMALFVAIRAYSQFASHNRGAEDCSSTSSQPINNLPPSFLLLPFPNFATCCVAIHPRLTQFAAAPKGLWSRWLSLLGNVFLD